MGTQIMPTDRFRTSEACYAIAYEFQMFELLSEKLPQLRIEGHTLPRDV